MLLQGLLNGKYGFGSVVGAYAHGFQAEDVDPSLDDRFLVSEKRGGSGNFSTVTTLVYALPDGTRKTRVFKPEYPSRFGLSHASISGHGGYDEKNRMGEINVVTSRCAERMGCGGTVVHATVGTHNGTIGFFMDKADGVPASQFAPGALDPKERIRCVGTLARELCKLEWLDWLTGQLDRHANNYLVERDKNGNCFVKGIDNDAAFMDFRIGLRRFVLNKDRQHELCRMLDANGFASVKGQLGELIRHRVLRPMTDCRGISSAILKIWFCRSESTR